jgi:predicted small lipoprotein YifL
MRRFVVAVLAVIPVVVACGSRGPLDDQPYSDASTDVGQLDGAVDGARDGAVDAPVDARPDVNPIINCGQCVAQQCGQKIATCIQDVACRSILQCAAQKCLGGGGGGLDPKCLSDCANGNLAGLAGAFSAFQCVTSKCGDACLSLLGGLGG